jgi:hypothetical protein
MSEWVRNLRVVEWRRLSALLILTLISGAVGRGQTVTDDFSKPVAPWVSRPGNALTKGSGFFRTLQAEGRWWLVDPEGKPFFDIGTDHVSYGGHWCEALGYAPYHRNVAAKYGSEAAWGRATLQRLRSWGFNCLPAGHSPTLRHQGLAHIEFASFGAEFARREWITRPVNWTGFPDVLSPRWETHCRILARNLARQTRGDPWCIGTFLDNELEWYGKSGQLADEVFQYSRSWGWRWCGRCGWRAWMRGTGNLSRCFGFAVRRSAARRKTMSSGDPACRIITARRSSSRTPSWEAASGHSISRMAGRSRSGPIRKEAFIRTAGWRWTSR